MSARVDRLEREVQRAREDAAAARVLAGGVDRDAEAIVREFQQYRDQNVTLHNATRADIADVKVGVGGLEDSVGGLENRLGGLDHRVGRLGERVDSLDNHVAGLSHHVDRLTMELRSKFDMVAAGQQQIVDLINQRFDDREL